MKCSLLGVVHEDKVVVLESTYAACIKQDLGVYVHTGGALWQEVAAVTF